MKAEFHYGSVKASMDAAEIELHRAQAVLHDHPRDPLFASLEVKAASKFKQAKEDYFVYVQQLAKLQWITHGDENTKIFHQRLKQRRSINCINVLYVDGFIVSDMDRIHQAFDAFYSDLLCYALPNRRKISMN